MIKHAGLVIDDDKIAIGNYKQIIHDRLKRLIFTPIGEGIGILSKGSYVPDMLNHLNEPTVAGQILSEIELLITMYEPLIKIS